MRSPVFQDWPEAFRPYLKSKRRFLGLTLLAAMCLGCGKTPKDTLLIVGAREFGAGELRGAAVSIDGQKVGTLEPTKPASWIRWLTELIEVSVDDSAILDGGFTLVFDLQKIMPGEHTVVIQSIGRDHVFTREFNHPGDLTDGVIWVHVGKPVNWPGCEVLVPPLLDCAQQPSGRITSAAVHAETVCRLVTRLKDCLGIDVWPTVEGIEVCEMERSVHISVGLEEHRSGGAAMMNKDTGDITCETY